MRRPLFFLLFVQLKFSSTVKKWNRIMGHGGNIDIDSTYVSEQLCCSVPTGVGPGKQERLHRAKKMQPPLLSSPLLSSPLPSPPLLSSSLLFLQGNRDCFFFFFAEHDT